MPTAYVVYGSFVVPDSTNLRAIHDEFARFLMTQTPLLRRKKADPELAIPVGRERMDIKLEMRIQADKTATWGEPAIVCFPELKPSKNSHAFVQHCTNGNTIHVWFVAGPFTNSIITEGGTYKDSTGKYTYQVFEERRVCTLLDNEEKEANYSAFIAQWKRISDWFHLEHCIQVSKPKTTPMLKWRLNLGVGWDTIRTDWNLPEFAGAAEWLANAFATERK